jgi:hypothetical protein
MLVEKVNLPASRGCLKSIFNRKGRKEIAKFARAQNYNFDYQCRAEASPAHAFARLWLL